MLQTKPTESKLTINDLAEQTGVSIGTVSRVLNQRGRVAAETRRRVLAAARAANFKPRVAARRTTVAVVSDRWQFATQGGYVSHLINRLADALTSKDVAVELFTERNIQQLKDRYVDGVIAMPWDTATLDLLRGLKEVPVVVMSRFDLKEFSVVGTDHQQGGRLVADYLLDRGHRQIRIIGEAPSWGLSQRYKGFEQAFAERGLELGDALVCAEHQPLYGAVRRAMADQPTALFAAGEDLSLEVSHVLKSVLGLRIGEDISVVAMENETVSKFLDPPETTLGQPLSEIACQAVELVTQQIDSGCVEPRHVELDNQLLIRESVVDLNTR